MADDPLTVLDKITEQTGTADNIVYHYDGDISEIDDIKRMLEKYGCI